MWRHYRRILARMKQTWGFQPLSTPFKIHPMQQAGGKRHQKRHQRRSDKLPTSQNLTLIQYPISGIWVCPVVNSTSRVTVTEFTFRGAKGRTALRPKTGFPSIRDFSRTQFTHVGRLPHLAGAICERQWLAVSVLTFFCMNTGETPWAIR